MNLAVHAHLSETAEVDNFISNNPYYVNSRDRNDCVPLHYATSPEICAYLLKRCRSTVSATDANCFDPAVFHVYYDIVCGLLDSGLYKRDRCTRGLTPLHYAVVSDRVAVASCLLDHGADVNDCDNELRLAPVHFAHSEQIFYCEMWVSKHWCTCWRAIGVFQGRSWNLSAGGTLLHSADVATRPRHLCLMLSWGQC